MSVMNTTAPITHPTLHATNECRTATRQPDRSPTPREPTLRQVLEGSAPLLLAPAYFGPPAISILGPWLLLVLLLVGPVALVFTLVLVFLVAVGVLAAVVALLASPYLLVRHLRARHHARRRGFALLRRPVTAAPAVGDSASQARSGAPVVA
jgi:Flp pilus assembly protein TadB